MFSLARRVTVVIGLTLLPPLLSPALASASGPQKQDPEFAREVREWTTRPEFLSPLVDHLPLVPGIPSPEDVLGYHIGLRKSSPTTARRIVDVPAGKGRVLLFATNPCYRWQNTGEFNLLFNAVLHFNDFAVKAEKPPPTQAGAR
jgi:hypothetical protein